MIDDEQYIKNLIKDFSFQRIKYIYDKVGKDQTANCADMAYVGARALVHVNNAAIVINTNNHAVVYDQFNTWDFYCNIVFMNYRYPQPLNSNIKKIRIWEDFSNLQAERIKRYYSPDFLLKQQTEIYYHVISALPYGDNKI